MMPSATAGTSRVVNSLVDEVVENPVHVWSGFRGVRFLGIGIGLVPIASQAWQETTIGTRLSQFLCLDLVQFT